jgi:hypothetical protein
LREVKVVWLKNDSFHDPVAISLRGSVARLFVQQGARSKGLDQRNDVDAEELISYFIVGVTTRWHKILQDELDGLIMHPTRFTDGSRVYGYGDYSGELAYMFNLAFGRQYWIYIGITDRFLHVSR